jgi:hypothetical protein
MSLNESIVENAALEWFGELCAMAMAIRSADGASRSDLLLRDAEFGEGLAEPLQ